MSASLKDLAICPSGRPGEVIVLGEPVVRCQAPDCGWDNTQPVHVAHDTQGLAAHEVNLIGVLQDLRCPACQRPLVVNAVVLRVDTPQAPEGAGPAGTMPTPPPRESAPLPICPACGYRIVGPVGYAPDPPSLPDERTEVRAYHLHCVPPVPPEMSAAVPARESYEGTGLVTNVDTPGFCTAACVVDPKRLETGVHVQWCRTHAREYR